jgi:hypothetical protein
VTKKRPTWSHDTFQNAKEIHMYDIDEPYHEEEQMAPPLVRHAAPPNTNSEGARVQRESSLRIQ